MFDLLFQLQSIKHLKVKIQSFLVKSEERFFSVKEKK